MVVRIIAGVIAIIAIAGFMVFNSVYEKKLRRAKMRSFHFHQMKLHSRRVSAELRLAVRRSYEQNKQSNITVICKNPMLEPIFNKEA